MFHQFLQKLYLGETVEVSKHFFSFNSQLSKRFLNYFSSTLTRIENIDIKLIQHLFDKTCQMQTIKAFSNVCYEARYSAVKRKTISTLFAALFKISVDHYIENVRETSDLGHWDKRS